MADSSTYPLYVSVEISDREVGLAQSDSDHLMTRYHLHGGKPYQGVRN
jgi:hypothetical protein